MMNPTLLCDFYKLSHREQYPTGTEYIYSTLTPRSNKYMSSCDSVVAFRFQAFIKKYLINMFNTEFFELDKDTVIEDYASVVKNCLGIEEPDTSHLEELHDLGYLPIEIKAVPEGTLVPMRVPVMTIKNTHPSFFWLTNYLETLMSCELWQPMTSATIAHKYRGILDLYAKVTAGGTDFVPFQGHDFSMRGMTGLDAAGASGSGHLLSFVGTDTIPAILDVEEYYNADVTKELVGTSIPATEHSVMCAGGKDDELGTYKRLINDVYPSGFVSIVSDTWDLWNTITNILPTLKDDILARDGKVVIRPDSGDPVDIVCGCVLMADADTPESKGVIELLWEIFGGTINEQGYKELDPHIGCIYGDAITLSRCEEICSRLKEKGFASTNMVYGIGSYTYQYNTRDTFGFALKSTACVINGEEKAIFKDPKTDDGTKKSATGAVAVMRNTEGDLVLFDGLSLDDELEGDVLRTIFKDGELVVDEALSTIRERLTNQ